MLLEINGQTVDVSRKAIIIDTNVLFALFTPEDYYHEVASVFIEELDEPPLAPISVLVETWGLLVGRNKRKDLGYRLLDWACSPGELTLIPDDNNGIANYRDIAIRFKIDLVDAILLSLADKITNKLSLNPPMVIATFDSRDFSICRRSGQFKIRIQDLRGGQTW